MVKEGQLQLGEFDLPVCMEHLPSSYSMLSPEVSAPLLSIYIGSNGRDIVIQSANLKSLLRKITQI